ncbi:MAG: DNA-directed RNA polymerase subunit alpha [Candidatus Shikimatogenerans sp. Ttur]|uniref:DNA-directed RNA polymerase subunit alpha n=1 Tax=Candidatus Shikimatogenerans sp. Ttur TaxID=3158569 RepID=A0AAU7ZXI3_9FLAO
MKKYKFFIKKKKKKIIISNLQSGFGITIGNSLRRVLINSSKGYAISAIKIKNINYEYTNLEGIYEDITDFILNLKKIRIKKIVKKKKKIYIINLKLKNKKKFLAKHIENYTNKFKIINKKLVLLNFSKNINFNIKLFITYGKGYIPSEDNLIINNYEKKKKEKLIKIDSIYTPIINVKFKIKKIYNNNEKLIIFIKTDNTISVKLVLYKTIKKLLSYYNELINCF